MIFWMIAGAISSLAAILMATPAMKAGNIKAGWVMALLAALVPMALYIWLGRPELLN